MATPSEMIEALGGVRKTAAALGIAPTTVQHWKDCDRVPTWREAQLQEAYDNRPPEEASDPTPAQVRAA